MFSCLHSKRIINWIISLDLHFCSEQFLVLFLFPSIFQVSPALAVVNLTFKYDLCIFYLVRKNFLFSRSQNNALLFIAVFLNVLSYELYFCLKRILLYGCCYNILVKSQKF